jgi:hypothetical protein
MTLSFDAYLDHGAAGTATISVTGAGVVLSGEYSNTYTMTVPVGTDLNTFSVTVYAWASGINEDSAEADIANIVVY